MFESLLFLLFFFLFFSFTRSDPQYYSKRQNQRNLQTQEKKLSVLVPSVLIKPHLASGLVSLSCVLLDFLNNHLISIGFFPSFPWCFLFTLSIFWTVDMNVTFPLHLICYPFSRCCFTLIDAYSTVFSHRVPLGNHTGKCLTIFSLGVTTITIAHGKITACVSDNTLLGQAGKQK